MNALINNLTRLSLCKSLGNVNDVRILIPKLNAIDNFNQKRNRGSTIRLIRGPPRPVQPFQEIPRAHDYRFRPILPLVRK